MNKIFENPKALLITGSSILLIISGMIEDFTTTTGTAPFDSSTAVMLFLLGCTGIAYGLITYKD